MAPTEVSSFVPKESVLWRAWPLGPQAVDASETFVEMPDVDDDPDRVSISVSLATGVQNVESPIFIELSQRGGRDLKPCLPARVEAFSAGIDEVKIENGGAEPRRNPAESRTLIDSRSKLLSPRAALMAALGQAIRDGALAEDTDLAKVATEALSKLFALAEQDGDVIDLGLERRNRGGP